MRPRVSATVEHRLREIVRLSKHPEMKERTLLLLIRAEAEIALDQLIRKVAVDDDT